MKPSPIWACTVLLLAGLCGCGGDRVVVPPGDEHLPPEVLEVFPAPRSEHVPYDLGEIWVSFAEPLDSTTVTASNVFLKLNTQRKPITVHWDGASRRILIRPDVPLDLAETFTIELRTGLKTAAGVPFKDVYWWQFTVSGIRRLRNPYPDDSGLASPHTPLSWDRTESAAGEVVYDLYVGPDSQAVARREVAPLRKSSAEHIPNPTTWGFARRYYWTVTARNLTLGEIENGPVWRFDTMPLGAPTDSVIVRASYYAYFNSQLNRTFCTEGRMIIGSGFNVSYQGVMRWTLTNVQPGRRVAAARVLLTLVTGTNPPPSSILSTKSAVPTNCQLSGGGAPLGDKTLANNTNVGILSYYMSDALTAHVAAMHRGLPSAHGFTFLATSFTASFSAPADMVIYFYR